MTPVSHRQYVGPHASIAIVFTSDESLRSLGPPLQVLLPIGKLAGKWLRKIPFKFCESIQLKRQNTCINWSVKWSFLSQIQLTFQHGVTSE